MRKSILIILILVSALGARERPKVGVALSGGGAKGLAHIGVLQVLEEVGLPIDCISGTSMGGIIGGLYAVGYSTDELEQIVREIDWDELFSGRLPRSAVAMEMKRRNERYVFSLPVRNRRVELPTGLLSDQKITDLLSRLTVRAHSIQDFRNLPIPFVCVATDLRNGETITLDHGFLPEALRATMAIPGAFSPVEIDDRLLADGGLTRHLPVEDVKNLGADIVIAVDVNALLHAEEDLDSFVRILDQTAKIYQYDSTLEQRQLADLLIAPDLEDKLLTDYGDYREIIARGADAAREKLPALQALKDTLNAAPLPRQPVPAPPDSFRITNLRLEGLKTTLPRILESELALPIPTTVSLQQIVTAVQRLHAMQSFEHVTYRIADQPNSATLVIKVEETHADMARFGFRFDSRSEAAILGNLRIRNAGMSHTFLNLDVKVGTQLEIDLQYLWRLSVWRSMGISLRTNYTNDFIDLFVGDRRIAKMDLDAGIAELLMGTLFSTRLSLATGLRFEYAGVEQSTGDTGLASSDTHLLNLVGLLLLDSLNRANFPTSGAYLALQNDFTHKSLGSDAEFTRHLLDLRGYVPLSHRLSAHAQIQLGHSTGDSLPLPVQFFLGGLDMAPLLLNQRLLGATFVGIKPQQLRGDHVQFGQVGLQYEILENIFLQWRLNAGNTFDDWQFDISPDRFEIGTGITVGALTPIGPIEASLMQSTFHDLLTNVNIGFKF